MERVIDENDIIVLFEGYLSRVFFKITPKNHPFMGNKYEYKQKGSNNRKCSFSVDLGLYGIQIGYAYR